MRIIAVTNQKGGTGKTTSTVNIGAGLHSLGKKVLLVDMDPQANLTYSLGIQAHELERTVYDLLQNESTLEEVIIDRNGLKVIPSSLELSRAETGLSRAIGRELLLRDALKKVKGFDFILIDSPPSLGLLTLNAMAVSQEVYIPLQAEFLSLQGLSSLLETIEEVRGRLNKKLKITGVIATRFDGRRNLNKEVVEKIKEYFGSTLFNTIIRENISLAEAPSYGQTIYEYKPRSYGAEDYMELSKEITQRS